MKLIVSHPTANNFSKSLIEYAAREDILHAFHTTIGIFKNDVWYSLSNLKPFADLRRRTFSTALKPFIQTHPWMELGRQIASKLGMSILIQHEVGLFCVDAIYRTIDRQVAEQLHNAIKQGVTVVYGYEDGALETFIKAKQYGVRCVYELPIAYWPTIRELLSQEAIRLPEWAITLGGGTQDSQGKLNRKNKELALADMVVVPSQFVHDSLPDWVVNKQVVISPFGTPTSPISERNKKTYSVSGRPLRVLFVGSMGQRKGLGDLFKAVSLLNRPDLELVVLGSLMAPMEFYNRQLQKFTYESGRSNEQVLRLMRTCDVFCLPSIIEGRALVMQEAMSQGLPLIITPNTGGADLIREGETGFLIPIRSPEAIAEKLIWFLENRSQIPKMGHAAQDHARTYTWDRYSDTIIQAIQYL